MLASDLSKLPSILTDALLNLITLSALLTSKTGTCWAWVTDGKTEAR